MADGTEKNHPEVLPDFNGPRITATMHSSEKLRAYILWLLDKDRSTLARIMGKYYNPEHGLLDIAKQMRDNEKILARFVFKIGYLGFEQEWVDDWIDRHLKYD